MTAVTLLQPAESLPSSHLFFRGTSNGGQGLDMLGKCCTLGHILGPKRALSGHVINVPSMTENPKEEVNDLSCPTSQGQLGLAIVMAALNPHLLVEAELCPIGAETGAPKASQAQPFPSWNRVTWKL